MKLTQHQIEVMDDIVAGLTSREIAEKRGVVHQTVSAHLDKIKDRLGATTTAQAAVIYSAELTAELSFQERQTQNAMVVIEEHAKTITRVKAERDRLREALLPFLVENYYSTGV